MQAHCYAKELTAIREKLGCSVVLYGKVGDSKFVAGCKQGKKEEGRAASLSNFVSRQLSKPRG